MISGRDEIVRWQLYLSVTYNCGLLFSAIVSGPLHVKRESIRAVGSRSRDAGVEESPEPVLGWPHSSAKSWVARSPCARRAGSANRPTEENKPSVWTSWEIKCCAPIHKDRTQVIRTKIHPQVSNSTNLGNQFNLVMICQPYSTAKTLRFIRKTSNN